MSMKIKDDQWVWVVIQDPGPGEQLLGQHDRDNDLSFIPVFLEKDAATQCMNHLALERGHKYEAQAILYEDLIPKTADQSFSLLLLNESGDVLERIET
ncbi:MAG: hypothetical protein JRF51_04905 [Deltaproteobacteria bacterium]|nr:hypothetical protein [Deltaproteobacteria bacterium]MBW2352556.1 hypothetical protein [Deltaproteobacteria bacterium]